MLKCYTSGKIAVVLSNHGHAGTDFICHGLKQVPSTSWYKERLHRQSGRKEGEQVSLLLFYSLCQRLGPKK